MIYLLYECRAFSFNYTSSKINQWKPTGLYKFNSDSHIDAVAVSNNDLPSLVNNGRLSVNLMVVILNKPYWLNQMITK